MCIIKITFIMKQLICLLISLIFLKVSFAQDAQRYLNEVYQLVSDSSELNTLGYVYLESGRIDQALTVFYFNTLFFSETSNVYDSYAEALAVSGQKEEAIKNYEKVLQLDQGNKHAIEQIEKLKE